jgi:trehalose 2-sulfotransferase
MATPDDDSYDRLFFEFERTEPRASYLVCSVPRSGSSLLCELLTSTGVAGAPAEFFHPSKMTQLKRRWGVDTMDDYMRELLARKTSPNGVFGTKAHWGQYQPLLGDSDPGEILPDPRVVLITRRDRLRQAVSWVRALQTQKWTNTDGPQVELPAVYEQAEISQKVARIDREEDMWDSLFARHGIEPHRIVYEDFVEAQEETVRAVLDALGVDAPADLHLPPPVLDRQADEQSDEWVERYLAEMSP